MPVWTAILAIVTLFLAVWALVIARAPKEWRLWLMTFMGIADLNSTREDRRRQEFNISIICYVMFSMCLAVSGVSIYYVVVQVQEQRQHTSSEYEQAKDKTMLDLEKIRAKKTFRKL